MPPSRSSASPTIEILILGGGPAGAAASRLLASWGHRVRLITRPPGDQRLAVSLPPSCAKLFDAIGVSEAIDRAGFIRSTGNTVWWGGDARVEPFADGGRGWQVDLGVLEEVLVTESERAGVAIERRVLTAQDAATEASFVLDCTGRAGVIARARNVRRYDEGATTIALAGEWLSDSWAVADNTHTIVESYADGWMWSVPTTTNVRHVSAMIDPQRSDLARGVPSREMYLSEIAKTRAFKELLADASLVDGPSGWDASTYRAEKYAGHDWLLVGDAGSFIDPLSSAGVKKALASGWLAAIVANTCVNTPSMRRAALEFFSTRETEIQRQYAAESRAFLTAAARSHDRPFWATRAADAGETHGDDEAIRRAFEELKASPVFRLTKSLRVRVEPRALVDGNEIKLAPHLIPADSAAIRYVNGVDLVSLLELAPTVSQVPDLFDAYVRLRTPPSLHDFLMALSTAVARGWLVAE